MTGKKSTHVSEEKKKIVLELSDLIKKYRTILVASIKDVPAADFQEIVKKLRGKAVVKVPKKSIIFRAFDNSGDKVKKVKEQVKESTAILFSDIDSHELAGELLSSKNPAKAKAGQEAPEDIEIPAGPTELVPGPAISELGALGIQIRIDKGKINIKEPKVIVKEGEKISPAAAELMSKLSIKPFKVGFTPLAAFDKEEGKLYVDLKIDKEETIGELKTAFGKALPFAVEIGYASGDTIKFLVGKAGTHGKALEKFAEADTSGDKETDNNKQKDSELKVENQSEPSGEANTQLDKSSGGLNMEYIYAALLLHKLGKEVNEEELKKVIASTGTAVDEGKVKSLVVSLKGVDIEKELESASLVAAAPTAGNAGEGTAERKKEEKPKEEKKEAAAEGLSALFG